MNNILISLAVPLAAAAILFVLGFIGKNSDRSKPKGLMVAKVIVLTIVMVACGSRDRITAVRSLQSGKVIDMTIHTYYQKGDTIIERSTIDPTVSFKYVVLE